MTELMRWRMFGYMAALFIAGGITGAAVMARSTAGTQVLKVGRSNEIANLLRQKMDPLNLTPEQQQKFEPLVLQTSEELEANHLQCLERNSTAIEKMHAMMEKDLTPEQQAKHERLNRERRISMRKKYNYPPETSATKP